MRFARWRLTLAVTLGLVAAGTPALATATPARPRVAGLDLDRATVLDLQDAMARHRLSSAALTAFYLHRIRTVDPALHAVLETNPDALREAFASDAQRRRGGAR